MISALSSGAVIVAPDDWLNNDRGLPGYLLYQMFLRDRSGFAKSKPKVCLVQTDLIDPLQRFRTFFRMFPPQQWEASSVNLQSPMSRVDSDKLKNADVLLVGGSDVSRLRFPDLTRRLLATHKGAITVGWGNAGAYLFRTATLQAPETDYTKTVVVPGLGFVLGNSPSSPSDFIVYERDAHKRHREPTSISELDLSNGREFQRGSVRRQSPDGIRPTRQAILLGGDIPPFESERGEAYVNYLIKATGKRHPRVAFFGVGLGEEPSRASDFINGFRKAGCEVIDVPLLLMGTPGFDPETLRDVDLIYVDGGVSVPMMGALGAWDVRDIIKWAYDNNVVYAGSSAGTLLAFDWGSSGEVRPKPLRGWNFVPGSVCCHYGQKERQTSYRQYVNKGEMPPGIGIDNGVLVHFENETLTRALTVDDTVGRAYLLAKPRKGWSLETPIPMTRLGHDGIPLMVRSIDNLPTLHPRFAQHLQSTLSIYGSTIGLAG